MEKHLKWLLLLCFMAILQSCATVTTKSIPIEKVVQIEKASKNKLYVRANQWMVDQFNNAKSVIQFSDKESGSISGRYLLGKVSAGSQYGPPRYVYASIKIRVKNGASKITIKPESFRYAEGNPYTLYTKEDVKKDVDGLIASFEKFMKISDDTNW